jgi:hunchback
MLWSHLRVHVPAEKLFHCTACPFVTELKHHWDTHCRNHEKQKPFKCTMCSYMAVNQSMINSHLKTHSSARPYVCRYPACNFKCKFSTQLRSHCEKKHGEQTSRSRKSSSRRSRGYVQDPEPDQMMTTTNSTLDASSSVSGIAVSRSPSADSSLLHDAATSWAMAAAAASVWSPHLAAASSLFGGLPFGPSPSTTSLHSASITSESLMAKAPLISSPFHQRGGYSTKLNNSPAQVVAFNQFSPLTAKIGAMQFGSPVAARALNLQLATAAGNGRNREPAAVPILHDAMLDCMPRNDQTSPNNQRTDDHCGVKMTGLTSSSSSCDVSTSLLPSNKPEFNSSIKEEFWSTSMKSDKASRSVQLVTSQNCDNLMDATPLDLTKKPSIISRESTGNSVAKTNSTVSDAAAAAAADSQCRKPSRRKGIAHKLDVVSANRYAVEEDIVEAQTELKHPASLTVASTKMAFDVNLSLDLSKTQCESSISHRSSPREMHGNKGCDQANAVSGRNSTLMTCYDRESVETANISTETRSSAGEECPYCDCVFHYSVMHVIHMEFHGPPEDPWKCNKCGVNCVDRVDFNDHIATVAHL